MEEQQSQQQQTDTPSSLFQLNVDLNASYLLRSAASWSRVMAIAGIVIGAMLVIIGFLARNAATDQSGRYEGLFGDASTSQGAERVAGTLSLILFLIFGAIFIGSGILALNFSNRIRAAIDTTDPGSLRAGFGALRTYFTFRTVIMIIWALLVFLMMIGLMNPATNAR